MYKLVSSKRKIVQTGETLDTWGANPKGFISYGNDRRMLVLIVADDRPKPESVEKITDQDRAKLFRTMTAYGGTYEFDGKTMEHHIDISWNEIWTGTTVIRELKRGRQIGVLVARRTIWWRWKDERGHSGLGEGSITAKVSYPNVECPFRVKSQNRK